MDKYRILIASDKIELESSDKSWLEQKEKQYAQHIDRILSWPAKPRAEVGRKGETTNEEPVVPNVGKISPNEFYRNYIQAKGVKARTDIATFFVYYLERVRGKKEISSGDVKDLFREAQYPAWNNINIPDALNKAKKKAFLNSVGGQWSLSFTGEDFVVNTISK